MELKELELPQLQEALKAGSPEEIKAHLEKEGIVLPAKAPWDLPDEIFKFGMKLWQTVMVTPRDMCEEDQHDYKPTGKCEMARNKATLPGSCFRTELMCTKCGAVKWITEKEPEKKVEEAPAEEA